MVLTRADLGDVHQSEGSNQPGLVRVPLLPVGLAVAQLAEETLTPGPNLILGVQSESMKAASRNVDELGVKRSNLARRSHSSTGVNLLRLPHHLGRRAVVAGIHVGESLCLVAQADAALAFRVVAPGPQPACLGPDDRGKITADHLLSQHTVTEQCRDHLRLGDISEGRARPGLVRYHVLVRVQNIGRYAKTALAKISIPPGKDLPLF
mmetsp:Transcript_59279/g.158676  ORF Transcript_59279/g.158676 Transcript_59279/m.158676 type:complete len:208 (+) Transcript_59279:1695-2318(+)